MHVAELYPFGWQLLHAKLLYVCSPPRILGWLSAALDQDLLGEWHDEHELP
jgi:hypothetical protein